MCIGFNYLRNSLISLNVLYVVVGNVLIYASVSEKVSPYADNLPLATGMEICGTFLIGLAMLGLVGAVKHQQVILFFYMIILFILFVCQVGVSYASMNMSKEQLRSIAAQSWNSMNVNSKVNFERIHECCSFENDFQKAISEPVSGPQCYNLNCCADHVALDCTCLKCEDQFQSTMGRGFKLAGQLGMLFSFTEIVGVWLTRRYRNQKDPRAHPSAFL